MSRIPYIDLLVTRQLHDMVPQAIEQIFLGNDQLVVCISVLASHSRIGKTADLTRVRVDLHWQLLSLRDWIHPLPLRQCCLLAIRSSQFTWLSSRREWICCRSLDPLDHWSVAVDHRLSCSCAISRAICGCRVHLEVDRDGDFRIDHCVRRPDPNTSASKRWSLLNRSAWNDMNRPWMCQNGKGVTVFEDLYKCTQTTMTIKGMSLVP